MTIAACVDNAMKITFMGKRQSRDRILMEDLFRYSDEKTLAAFPYSMTVLPEEHDVLLVESPDEVPEDGILFVEKEESFPDVGRVDALILYHWNRDYPGTESFPYDLNSFRLSEEETEEFTGSSHEKITREVYYR